MSEETNNFDPKDKNQDGKVSFKERIQDAAEKAGEALNMAAAAIKDETGDAFEKVKQEAGDMYEKVKQGAEEAIGKVKDYAAMSPEERKVKNDEILDKASAAADKIAGAAKAVYEDAKESAGKIFGKKEE